MIDINRLYQYSKDITVTTDPKPLYRKIVESAKEMLELDFSTLLLLSEDKSYLSVFHVYLPSAEKMAKLEKEKISPERKVISNKIMVVEDEPQILELIEDMLLKMGYQVLKASNGSKALEIFRNEKDDIKMAIIDMLMPGMDGRSLFKALKDVNPDLKVLISSGYDETTALKGLAPYRPEGYIQKPYRFKALKEKLREILKD